MEVYQGFGHVDLRLQLCGPIISFIAMLWIATSLPSIPSDLVLSLSGRSLVKSALVRCVEAPLRINEVRQSFSASARDTTFNCPLLSIDTPRSIDAILGDLSERALLLGGAALLSNFGSSGDQEVSHEKATSVDGVEDLCRHCSLRIGTSCVANESLRRRSKRLVRFLHCMRC
jgi:hypothetical protein